MTDMIQGRRGEKILLSEYPDGLMDGLNARLNRIAAIDDGPEPVGRPERPTLDDPFDRLLTVAGNAAVFGSIALAAVIGVAQLVIWLT